MRALGPKEMREIEPAGSDLMSTGTQISLVLAGKVADHFTAERRIGAQGKQLRPGHLGHQIRPIAAHHAQPCALDELAEARGGRKRVFGIGASGALDLDDAVDQSLYRLCATTTALPKRINRFAVHPKLEVQMRPGGPPGGADIADHLPRLHALAFAGVWGEAAHMGVAGLAAIGVVDIDGVAIAARNPGKGNTPAGGGLYRGAGGRRPIDAVVIAQLFQDRVMARPKARGTRAADRYDKPAAQYPAPSTAGGVEIETTEPVAGRLCQHIAGHVARLTLDGGIEDAAESLPHMARLGGIEDGEFVTLGGKAIQIVTLRKHHDQFTYLGGR